MWEKDQMQALPRPCFDPEPHTHTHVYVSRLISTTRKTVGPGRGHGPLQDGTVQGTIRHSQRGLAVAAAA